MIPNDPRIEALQKELADLRKQLEPKLTLGRRGSPFSNEILAAPISNNVRIPQLSLYGGEKGEPRDHIDQFITAMDLVDPSDVMLCSIFRTTLIGNKRYPKNPSHLFAVVRKEGELFRAYIQRFDNEMLDVPNVNTELLSGIMAQGLRNGGLADSLIGEPATNWDDLLS
ncbi:hypothetical protein Salat_0695300 [Sesamum alatum]|uniref:Uncharacterized protein n=1 Tax=Sesamum alatum TaxID=300844 RepID=A0AAE2CV67_9LAMI|nr:hypothetical protein Salat_0695300 [Sesamum alatum]